MNYLEYALAYLERELEIIDDEVIEVELPGGDWEFVPNPYYEEGLHDSPHYRSQVAKDILDIKGLLGR
ncbi:TPA: hypothetical protein VPC71_000819 [Streptococcus pyogenes]|uniref:Uncharacterized protein n=2 Tax=Streptococcus pyogenes TaxID=1314 RepID=A0A4U7IWU8_STRPY|nr:MULTISPECIES: hypothetical protein [Streptococcus]ABF36533.1 phage protein [Streptococcus pyogenes MGAS2096]EPZ41680.1 hypothetical protein HMPREF1228_0515 [Streptococcus pyogenes GA41345]EQL79827.1 hypothetical protein HMPREF1225_0168 [Streptococcus pyogenes UTSW-2]ERL17924.1 hypothetical protein HMPREF1227_1371 [Streptococcus pyogenes GA41046]EZM57127.1 hypothetical protein Z176_01132 [Streptococcus pyogenes ABC020046230]QBX14993.1 hypothetical protein Javan163_0040 [Streptococcus phage 